MKTANFWAREYICESSKPVRVPQSWLNENLTEKRSIISLINPRRKMMQIVLVMQGFYTNVRQSRDRRNASNNVAKKWVHFRTIKARRGVFKKKNKTTHHLWQFFISSYCARFDGIVVVLETRTAWTLCDSHDSNETRSMVYFSLNETQYFISLP